MKSVPIKQTHHPLPLDVIVQALLDDERVIFAYLYGSSASGQIGRDIDIAVYAVREVFPHELSADLKITLHNLTGLPPDSFDIRVLNALEGRLDVFSLLYLRDLLERGRLLLDRDPALRAAFLEDYGFRYRECEGLIQEALA